MADKQQRFALMSIFKKRLKEKNLTQEMNLYSQQWAADALIESYGYDQCLNIIDYYFNVSSSPTWTWFTYNADKVLQSKSLEEEDMAVRKILRQKAKGWMEN